jgi:hypothetical protein
VTALRASSRLAAPQSPDAALRNNASEQELRPSVIFRKATNGFRLARGAKVYRRLAGEQAVALALGRPC